MYNGNDKRDQLSSVFLLGAFFGGILILASISVHYKIIPLFYSR